MMKYLSISLPFLLVFIFLPLEGMDIGSANGFAIYSFQHANIFHLIGNMMVFIPMVKVMREHYKFSMAQLIVAPYVCASVSALLYQGHEVIVGASGMVYALLAMYYTSAICGYHIKIVRKKRFVYQYLFTVFSMSIPFLFSGGVSVFVHTWSWVFGSIYALVIGSYYNVVKRGYY